MQHLLARIWGNLGLRISGLMKFRLLVPLATAIFLAIRDGLKDARNGKPPYFWTMFTRAGQRWAMLQDGWKSVGRLFVLAIVEDAIYQFTVQRWVYPGETLLVSGILAIVPYLLVRGPVNRIALLSRNTAKKRKIGG
jgi:hypothetical protein